MVNPKFEQSHSTNQWLGIRKSIAGHCFQNTRKFYNNDLQYHSDVIHSVKQYILTKNLFFPHAILFYIDSW